MSPRSHLPLLPLVLALGGCPDAPGWVTFPLPGASAADTEATFD